MGTAYSGDSLIALRRTRNRSLIFSIIEALILLIIYPQATYGIAYVGDATIVINKFFDELLFPHGNDAATYQLVIADIVKWFEELPFFEIGRTIVLFTAPAIFLFCFFLINLIKISDKRKARPRKEKKSESDEVKNSTAGAHLSGFVKKYVSGFSLKQFKEKCSKQMIAYPAYYFRIQRFAKKDNNRNMDQMIPWDGKAPLDIGKYLAMDTNEHITLSMHRGIPCIIGMEENVSLEANIPLVFRCNTRNKDNSDADICLYAITMIEGDI